MFRPALQEPRQCAPSRRASASPSRIVCAHCLNDHQRFARGSRERSLVPVPPDFAHAQTGGAQIVTQSVERPELQSLTDVDHLVGVEEFVDAVHGDDAQLVRRRGGRCFTQAPDCGVPCLGRRAPLPPGPSQRIASLEGQDAAFAQPSADVAQRGGSSIVKDVHRNIAAQHNKVAGVGFDQF